MKPVIYWASDPVLPDETVMLIGTGFGTNPAVEAARLGDGPAGEPAPEEAWTVKRWQRISPAQASDGCVKFVMPAGWKTGLFACRVVAQEACSRAVLVNRADPWWLQADEGKTGTPGGWLRVFGKCLNFKDYAGKKRRAPRAAAILRPSRGRAVRLAAERADGYALRFALPAALKLGTYEVLAHNGYGGRAGWQRAGMLEVRRPRQWPKQVFNVMDYYGAQAEAEARKTWEFSMWTGDVTGCSAEDYHGPDRTAAVQAALKQAERNGGGIVYFPPGRYRINSPLRVPPRTLLKGEHQDRAWLYFHYDMPDSAKGSPFDDGELKTQEPLISGTDFALEDLSIYFPLMFQQGLRVEPESRAFWMKRLRLRVLDQNWRWAADLSKIRRELDAKGETVVLMGRNFEITDCDLHAAKDTMMLFGASYGLVARNRIRSFWRCQNIDGIDRVIIEDNECQGLSMYSFTNFTTYWNVASENLYYARNRLCSLFPDQSANDWTLDFGTTAYLGQAQAEGTRLTLAQDPKFQGFWKDKPPKDWSRALVAILDGRGVGQYRRVVRNEGRVWDLDRPWDVVPDRSSMLTIASFQGNVLFLDNYVEDAAWVALAYSSSLNVIAAGNELQRCGSFHAYGRTAVEWGYVPCWRIQFLDNQVGEGHTRFTVYGLPPNELKTKFEADQVTRGVLFRRNRIAPGNVGANCHRIHAGKITVGESTADVLVEDCETREVRVNESTRGILVRNNHWVDSAPSYTGDGLKSALVISGPGLAKRRSRPV
jgi:hypothetical protein